MIWFIRIKPAERINVFHKYFLVLRLESVSLLLFLPVFHFFGTVAVLTRHYNCIIIIQAKCSASRLGSHSWKQGGLLTPAVLSSSVLLKQQNKQTKAIPPTPFEISQLVLNFPSASSEPLLIKTQGLGSPSIMFLLFTYFLVTCFSSEHDLLWFCFIP